MWSGVKKAIWGHKSDHALKIQQLNGESADEYLSAENKSKQSQSDWDVSGNRFEEIDEKIQRRRAKSFPTENLRSPSLMFWRPTEDMSDHCPQKGSTSKTQPSRSLAFTLWSQVSDISATDEEHIKGRDDERGTKHSRRALSWTTASEPDEATQTTMTDTDAISFATKSEFRFSTEIESFASEGPESSQSLPEGADAPPNGKKKLRRKSSLLEKLRNGLVDLSTSEDRLEGTVPPRNSSVAAENLEVDYDSGHVRRLSTFMQKLSGLSGGGAVSIPDTEGETQSVDEGIKVDGAWLSAAFAAGGGGAGGRKATPLPVAACISHSTS